MKAREYLIKALPYLNINYKVLIAGDGPLKKELINLAKSLQVDRKVEFLGYVPDIENFYKKIDILVVPSLHESFGMSVIEAQSLGALVIASRIGGLREIIIDKINGLLFEPKNYLDLTKIIELVHRDKKLLKDITNSAKKSVKEYDIENYLFNLNNLYQSI